MRICFFSKTDLYNLFPPSKVDTFLQLFSCKPAPSNFIYYTDQNPIESAPIIQLAEDKYLHVCQKQIPAAIYQFLYKFLLDDKVYHDKIRKHRERNLENKIAAMFKAFFSTPGAFFYKNYFVEKNVEQDLLILYKGTAVIVEAKASKLRPPFRSIDKAIVRLKDDFKDAVQYGYNQCKRVEQLFSSGEVFQLLDEKGNVLYRINPSKYHSIYSIVVTLERFGCLQTDLSLLLHKEPDNDYPWSVYIDDLEIFLLSLKQLFRNHEGKLFEFLRSRRYMHQRLYAIDELDICARYCTAPEKFVEQAKRGNELLLFSPYEQAFFDTLYFSGKLRFQEKPLPEIDRYFKH